MKQKTHSWSYQDNVPDNFRPYMTRAKENPKVFSLLIELERELAFILDEFWDLKFWNFAKYTVVALPTALRHSA